MEPSSVESQAAKLLDFLSRPLVSSILRTHPNDLGAQPLPLGESDPALAEVPYNWSWWKWAGNDSRASWKLLIEASLANYGLRESDKVRAGTGRQVTYSGLPDELYRLTSEANLLSLPRFSRIVPLHGSGEVHEYKHHGHTVLDIPSKGMSPKKYHEVSRMTTYVLDLLKKICDSTGVDVRHVVDIGAGQGYLARSLYSLGQIHVLALDSSAHQTEGSERRFRQSEAESNRGLDNEKGTHPCIGVSSSKGSLSFRTVWLGQEPSMHNHPGKASSEPGNGVDLEHVVDDWLLGSRGAHKADESMDSPSSRTPVVFVALHACGSLTPTILRKALALRKEASGSQKERPWFVAAAVTVGCCYNLIEKSDFPLSNFVKTQIEKNCSDFAISSHHLQLAAQVPSQWLQTAETTSASELAMKKVLYRALITPILLQVGGSVQGSATEGRRLGKLGNKAYENFGSFLYFAGQKLGIDLPKIFRETHHSSTVESTPLARRLETLQALRCLLGPPVESLLILDRYLWLQETLRDASRRPSMHAYLVNLFDQATGSGRNVGIVMCPLFDRKCN